MQIKYRIILSAFFMFFMPNAIASEYFDDEKIKSWATEAVIETLTYNHENYEERFKENSLYFTKDGWDAYEDVLNKIGFLDKVRRNKLNLMTHQSQLKKSEICNVEDIERQRIRAIVVPIRTIYTSEKDSRITEQLVLVFVNEIENGDNTSLAIDQWISVGIRKDEPCAIYKEITELQKRLSK